MKKTIDIINVAGLMLDGSGDGIEAGLKERDGCRSLQTIAPTPPKKAREHPDESISRTMDWIQEAADQLKEDHGNANIILIGRSYGGFVALAAAVRLHFENILHVITFLAPLHPTENVSSPTLIPLGICAQHYNHRPEIAQECVDYLQNNGTSKLTLVQGKSPDGIVPNAAQILPGDFHRVDLSERPIEDSDLARTDKGSIVTFQPHEGEKGAFKKMLPQSYRNHLFWPPEKMDHAQNIIGTVMKNTSASIQSIHSTAL